MPFTQVLVLLADTRLVQSAAVWCRPGPSWDAAEAVSRGCEFCPHAQCSCCAVQGRVVWSSCTAFTLSRAATCSFYLYVDLNSQSSGAADPAAFPQIPEGSVLLGTALMFLVPLAALQNETARTMPLLISHSGER